MQNTISKKEIKDWLLNRGLSEEVIASSGIWWDEKGNRIVIPVYNSEGKLIFNKYRKNPFEVSPTPKYMYDKGSSVSLYNVHAITNQSPIFICEGELDCLLLNSAGQAAVTSTGGAGSFQKEWAVLFEGKEVFICLDNDDAGVRGAIKIQRYIPHAKFVYLPDQYGKDVTEFIQKKGWKFFQSILDTAINFKIPREPDDNPTDVKELKRLENEFGKAVEEVKILERTVGDKRVSMMREFLLEKYLDYKHLKNQILKPRVLENVDDIKRIPITNFLSFNRDGFTKCIFHDEKTGSMKYNSEKTKYPNTVHCFSCGKTWDVISVYMKIHDLPFKEAIKRLKEPRP